MILDRIWASGAEARLVPAGKLHGPTVALTAMMTFAMMIVAAAGLSLANAAALIESGANSRYVVEIPSAAASVLPKAAAAAKSVPGVRQVTVIPESEMRLTLQRWLGEAASSSELPVPVLAMVELAPGADPAKVAAAVGEAAPEATFIAESAELQPLLSSVRELGWIALALVLLMAAATAAAIMLAARGALDTHRPTVEIMHGIGATDRQVIRLFERKIAADTIAGALAGAIAAAAVLTSVAAGLAASSQSFAPAAPVGLADLAVLALVPLAAVVIAVAVAHRTLLRALRASL